ncbi:PorP/SprF family type IX secretion system membrane protein [Ekhidna sp.]|uniref:PorP/SprF family type IX secretion system membrane protein n=1 Tax=Ekhidna sp. TaxID=2608089 RepID=UPI003B50952B
MKSSLKVYSFLFLLGAANLGLAQNDYFFNHYTFNPSYFNAAWVGNEKQAFVAMHHRTQWAGYDASFDPEGAPSTQLLSLVVPTEGKLSGVGLSVSNDQSGPLNSIQARFAISARQEFNFGGIAIGLSPAINIASINANYRFVDPGDNLIPGGSESQFKPNLHASVFFQSKKEYFIGAGAENILQPKFNFGTDASNTVPLSYTLMAGTSVGFARELLFKPSILIRSDLKAYTYDITAIMEYQERMWGGVAFRRGESISVLLGYSFLENNKLRAGYSFDYIVKDQDAKQPTSHEVFIRYNLPSLVFGGRKAVKTPRFTF